MVHAVYWHNGAMTDLGTLPGDDESEATAVNDAGVVAGTSWQRGEKGDREQHAFVWHDGTLAALEMPSGGQANWALDISERGRVVGGALVDGVAQPMLWDAGAAVFLVAPPSVGGSVAVAINDAGEVVGNAESNAVLWVGQERHPLKDLIAPSSDWDLWSPVDINDAGQILITGVRKSGDDRKHCLILTPMTATVEVADENAAQMKLSP